jgi:two-component system cell cycle sensor histidine kinase/response regulator CckA
MKPEIVFGLEGAAWPALLVDANGTVLRSNAATTTAFGEALTGVAPKLEAVWASENGVALDAFLTMAETTPVSDLKFKATNGQTTKFTVAVSTFSRDGNQWFVLQLLPPSDRPVQAAPVTPTAPPAPSIPTTKPLPEEIASSKLPADAGAVLKQKLDCALQLARTVSLDFNNALTGILGHTSLLLGKADPGHPWRTSLLEVEKSAARAAEVASELQTFSRNEKESKRVPAGNLNAVAQRCVDFFKNAHGAKITWNLRLEPALFGARFDEAKVQQTLTKILENAAEAVLETPGAQVTVQTRNMDLSEATQDRNVKLAAGAYVCVEVTDNGPGIDPEILPRIFEPFFTTKGKSHRGLGLALVYGIITNHGGGVAISSQPGSGTSARVYLPAEKELAREGGGPGEHLGGTETVLVVDDEALVLTMAETILTDFGYKVLTANGGQKALTILSRGDTHVDLVVTDLVMPGIGGRELVERIRQLNPAINILCTSGYTLPSDHHEGTLFLQKPFTSRQLLSKVRRAIVSTTSID